MSNRSALHLVYAFAVSLALSACNEDTAPPEEVALTRDAIGHYCNMIVADHPGPKAQIHEAGKAEPIWFSSVRDGFVYMNLPGEAQSVTAFFVHDMGQVDNYSKPPDNGAWIEASKALYVINSKRRGGMGAKETIPFKKRAAADQFVKKHGGTVVSYDAVPKDYIIGDGGDHQSAGSSSSMQHETGHKHQSKPATDADHHDGHKAHQSHSGNSTSHTAEGSATHAGH